MQMNKRGSFLQDNMGWIMLFLIVLLILVLTTGLFGKNTSNSLTCTSKNGVCRTTCEAGELPWYYDTNRTCEKINQKCCMPSPGAGTGTVTSNECKGKAVGATCSTASGEYYMCNEQSQCITKCEFCSTHPAHDLCKKAVSGVDFNQNFICGCTESECNDLKKLNPPKCTKSGVGGFCYSGAYCCEK
jgi:hypothetical protein